ncbi:MAG: prepilin-type N-terminal cleavage/methylation domain-containing protein [Candidatus Omnitrophica bacterium]|nr:prepilin-type N-terminal cleavage/methylation domain-containing protein [Candidatus Omnitrophota bacterium]
MILKIGNKKYKGFSLVEVMVATVFLVFSTILIYETFFTLFDAFGYYSSYLEILPIFEEKIYKVQNALSRNTTEALEIQGEIVRKGRLFLWDISYEVEDELKEVFTLYRIFATIRWKIGRKSFNLERIAYALCKK